MNKFKFSIIIPLYNESDNISKLINEIVLVMQSYLIEYEIILINDGSEDETQYVIENLILPNIKIVILKHEKNLGQSKSLLTGINKASSENIITIDGDGQNDPSDIPRLIDVYINNDFKLVGGIRLIRNDNYLKKISSKLANFVRRLILNDDCLDTGCSLKIFNRNIFLSFPFFDGIHRFLPALFKGYGNKTFFLNVKHRARVYGVSSYGTLDRLQKGLWDLYKVFKIIRK